MPISDKTKSVIILLLYLLYFCNVSAANVIYVDDDAAGANNGSSWENAYIFLQDALTEAEITEKPIEIRVAQGKYTPDKGVEQTPELASFELIDGVTLSGGYAGIMAEDPNLRDIELYETVLSGDILNNDSDSLDINDLAYEPTYFDNSFHVVIGSFTDQEAVLDGFTITAGNAGGDYQNSDSSLQGGGMYIIQGRPIIRNCTFTLNTALLGGAVYNNESNPTIENCRFIRNSANYYGTPSFGGGIFNLKSSPNLIDCEFSENLSSSGAALSNFDDSNAVITSCIFSNNVANEDSGGALLNIKSNPLVTDCDFVNNYAGMDGGAIQNDSNSSPVISNCTFTANRADSSGAGISSDKSKPMITGCRFTENSSLFGGCIYEVSSDSNIINCVFRNNQAKVGGAIESQLSNSIFMNCQFINNKAYETGGAIKTHRNNSILTNCIFSGNYAVSPTSKSSAFCNVGSDTRFMNCTLIDNATMNSNHAVLNEPFISEEFPDNVVDIDYVEEFIPGNIDFLNCIIWNGQNAITNIDSSTVSLNYCDIQTGILAIDDPENNLTWGTGNFEADSCFVSTGFWADINDANVPVEPNDPNAIWFEGDYHLKSTAGHYDPNSKSWIIDDVNSPCIDSGDPNSTFTDEPLPNGGRINIGAHGGTYQASMSPGEPLIAYWALDETEGDIANDSASDNHAIVNEPQWTEGRQNGALRFNGLRTTMDCGDFQTLGTEQMTISLWLNPSHMGGMRYILSRAESDLSTIDYTLMIHYEGNIEFEIGQDGTDPLYILSNAIVPLDQWTHVAITLNGSLASIYINGQLDSCVDYTRRTANQDYTLTIGSHQGSTRFYNGKMDEIRFYNRALNQQQIEILAQ